MPSPLDIQRLAVRIEGFKHADTHDWNPGDEMEFRTHLPGGRSPHSLPTPEVLRSMVTDGLTPSETYWRIWLTVASRMEGFIRNNDPRNPQKMIRDMVRGKGPMGWRR